MKTSEIVNIVSRVARVNVVQARRAVWGVRTAIHEALRRREAATIYGIGTFRVVRAVPRVIHSISDNEKIVCGSRKVKFLPSRTLKTLR